MEEALNLLEQGNSLLLASPRRVGKSSFSKKLIELARERGYSSVYLDLQGVGSEQEFGDRLADSLRKVRAEDSGFSGMIDNVGRLFRRVKKVEVKGVGLEFREDSAKFYSGVEKLIGSVPKGRMLIVFDELAVFLQRIEEQNGIESVESILNWMRKLRQVNQDKLRWIFCSSVSITNYAGRNNLSYTINDLTPFKLGEMSYEEAAGLLHQNTEEYGRIGMDASADRVIEVIIGEHQLSSWSERLSGYGKYEKAAQLLLNCLCLPEHRSDRSHLETVINPGCSASEDVGLIYSEVRQMLDTDGYLMDDEDGNIVFRSPVIRQYWFNKFVK